VEALTYDATRLLLEALQRAGPRRVALRQALADLSPWNGIAGTIAFDGTGQNTRAELSIGTYRNGLLQPGGLAPDASGATTCLTPTLNQTSLP
jgi:ABC-type branched-subunit amino acid transport system substrate-binding protein